MALRWILVYRFVQKSMLCQTSSAAVQPLGDAIRIVLDVRASKKKIRHIEVICRRVRKRVSL